MSLYPPEHVRHAIFCHRFLSLHFAYFKFKFWKFLQAPNELWKEVLNFLCVTRCRCVFTYMQQLYIYPINPCFPHLTTFNDTGPSSVYGYLRQTIQANQHTTSVLCAALTTSIDLQPMAIY
jgi:hypothetical protein